MSSKSLYRITFIYLDVVYEMYARKIQDSELFGFIVIEDFVFGEETTLVLDPAEERLKIEFAGVKKTFIPMQAVFRIDEVNKRGVSKVMDRSPDQNKVTAFPLPGKPKI